MNYNFENIDIILLAMIAGFILLRLKSVLGRKTHHENKPQRQFKDEIYNKENSNNNDKFFDLKTKTTFDENQKNFFLKGAKISYETIITSFAKGDKKSLKSLLGKDIFDQFSEAIDERNSKQIKSETSFIGFKSANIENFVKKDNIYTVTVKFVSEIITCLKDKNNKIIEGNPDQIKTVNDCWKFSRNMWSQNPTWYLVETQK